MIAERKAIPKLKDAVKKIDKNAFCQPCMQVKIHRLQADKSGYICTFSQLQLFLHHF
jgi:hypothetical protein